MTSSIAMAMRGCPPYVLRVKCTHGGSFITASLLCPRLAGRGAGGAGVQAAERAHLIRAHAALA